jgi:hypothetical protein
VSFVWKTSSIGFPNFFRGDGASHQLADFYRRMADATSRGVRYKEAKKLFPISAHQVETKKAAFQEFGLLYVVPHSDVISITPVGQQLLQFVRRPGNAEQARRNVLLLLAHSLSRYQFDNPLPIGGNRNREWAVSTDVLPYLAGYYLLRRLNGILTVSELLGAVFGLKRMKDLPELSATIIKRRRRRQPFDRLDGLPENEGTVENIKIYFMAHLSLDSQIIRDQRADYYGFEEQCYECTGLGAEIITPILDSQFRDWRSSHPIVPTARPYQNEIDYFSNVVGVICPDVVFERDARIATRTIQRIGEDVLTQEDIDALQELPGRTYAEGSRKLVTHRCTERNPSLVRAAKREFKRRHRRLFCEVCGFNFEEHYGVRGRDFIEAHHKVSISALTGSVHATIGDIAMVCPNCHRMLHRPPWITVEQLREQLRVG